jgi:hypothetical protein
MALKKSKDMMMVFEKARSDTKFAKELFMDPAAACRSAGISLDKTETKLLSASMNQARTYFLERVFLLASAQTSRGDNYCCISCEAH